MTSIKKGENIVEQKEMIQLAKYGDKEVLVDLLRSVEKSIYNTAFYYMGNEHDAKDVTQDALIKIYTKIDTFQEKSQFNTWVQRITYNICMDKFRKNKHEVSIEGAELVLPSDFETEQKIENKIIIEDLISKILMFPEKIKVVMILRYVQEFSYQEISDVLNVPINTVKSYLFRGREKLLKEYHRGGEQQ